VIKYNKITPNLSAIKLMKKTPGQRTNTKKKKGAAMNADIRAGILAKSIASDKYEAMAVPEDRKKALKKSNINLHRARKRYGLKSVNNVCRKG
jgi:hypothetical protein